MTATVATAPPRPLLARLFERPDPSTLAPVAKVAVYTALIFWTLVCLGPLYWVLISLAAWKGLWQLIWKPHYWEKTVHGLDEEHPPQG